jgi:hypothetical protein
MPQQNPNKQSIQQYQAESSNNNMDDSDTFSSNYSFIIGKIPP